MKSPAPSSESGFSMVGVLMITGAGLVAVLLILRSQVYLRAATKSLDTVNSYYGLIGGWTDFVHNSVKANHQQLCLGQTAALANLTFNDKNVAFASPLIVPGAQVAAVRERCQRPLFAADGRMYFCLALTPNENLADDSFGGAAHNFAEIAVQAVDKWQRPITCANYQNAAAGTAALQIYFRLYWITQTQPNHLHQKYGYYYGTKE